MDAIAEFVLVTNRFDATQGRSAGMLANAITKSGTNAFAGTLSGFFRSDRFNAADHIQKRVLPYSNQQVSGDVRRPDRAGSAAFLRELRDGARAAHGDVLERVSELQHRPGGAEPSAEGRGPGRPADVAADATVRARPEILLRPAVRRHRRRDEPSVDGAPRAALQRPGTSPTFTQVLGNSAVNEIKGGVALYDYTRDSHVTWMGGCFPMRPSTAAAR